MSVTYPNESAEYREARSALLEAEADLRAQVERVAAMRRALPPGGLVSGDYSFHELVDGAVREVRLSQLFKPGDRTLFAYSFMYGPDMDAACPLCTAFLDGIDAQIPHLEQQISTVVIAKHAPEILASFAQARGWRHLRLVSSQGNSYNRDYHGEVDGKQMTAANVFERDPTSGEIRHFWGSELGFGPMFVPGGTRHIDLAWPLWNVLDMTRQGRGDWFPALEYAGRETGI